MNCCTLLQEIKGCVGTVDCSGCSGVWGRVQESPCWWRVLEKAGGGVRVMEKVGMFFYEGESGGGRTLAEYLTVCLEDQSSQPPPASVGVWCLLRQGQECLLRLGQECRLGLGQECLLRLRLKCLLLRLVLECLLSHILLGLECGCRVRRENGD